MFLYIRTMELYKLLHQASRDCNKREREFALQLSAGATKYMAYKTAFNYTGDKADYVRRRANELLAGRPGEYYALLVLESTKHTIAPYVMDRVAKMRYLTGMAMKAAANYDLTGEAAHAAAGIKAINSLNQMSGDNAAQEVNIKGMVMQAAFRDDISPSEATAIYRRVMEGARIEADTNEKPGLSLVPSPADTCKQSSD